MSVSSALQPSFLASVPSRGAGKCSRCGRALKDPASVARGMGPVCSALQAADDRSGGDSGPAFRFLTDPAFGVAVVFGYDKALGRSGPFYANVPFFLAGKGDYQCGYDGSGPAGLALNIAEQALKLAGFDGPRFVPYSSHPDEACFRASYAMMQDLKRAFTGSVASTDRLNRIKYETIAGWVSAWLADNADSWAFDRLADNSDSWAFGA